MKKVINSKLYDTATAERVSEWDNGYRPSDFAWSSESLYRKRTGEYFLHGEGGPRSQYCEWHGNSVGGGEKILPFTLAEARDWAESHLDGDAYEKIFGEVDVSEGDRVDIFAAVPAALKKQVDDLKSLTGLTLSAIVEAALEEYVKANG